ncbi:MAG: ferredoxin [Spirochaetales bacterium]|jgi:aerobic-type carbon monoxide dehydrogenase small subunit (CoxS/CutS family)|nr:ferredoxin [Spirochaetales bacterium]
MKIKCSIDNKSVLLDVNSNKPLNLILIEESEGAVNLSSCNNNLCGNCVVLFNDEATLACLIPAFRLKGAKIVTFEGYQKSRFWHDLERAYNDTGSQPCPHCFNSKTLIFESLLQRIIKEEATTAREEEIDEYTIVKELSLNSCPCLDAQEIIAIYNAAAVYRRRRRVRRS